MEIDAIRAKLAQSYDLTPSLAAAEATADIHARRTRAAALVSVGLMDTICPPSV